MISGLDTSSVGLAVRKVAQEKGQIDLNVGSATADLTGPACSADRRALGLRHLCARPCDRRCAVVKNGGDTWFFVTADYAFGKSMEDEATKVIKAAGGKVLGDVRHPLSTQDFSSFMLQAQASKAKIVGLANAGMDTVNAIKQAGEFGLVQGGQRVAALLIFESDVQSLGLQTAQGLVLTTAFYWDQNDETRAWTKRFRAKRDKLPNLTTAGVYSATAHYLKAVAAAGTDDPKAVMAKMHETADQRLHDQERQAARGRPRAARHVPRPGEVAGRVQGQGRHLQDPRDGAGRQGLASAEGRSLPVHQVIRIHRDEKALPTGGAFFVGRLAMRHPRP